MTTTQIPADNGVNVEALLGVRDALADTPEIAQFQWRSTVSWVNGTHSRSDVETFYGFGEEQQHHARFSYDVDHPLQFAAQDNGVTPVEYVLVALGSCLTAGVAAVAQQRSIQLRSVRATLNAEMDLHGIRGADPDGYLSAREVAAMLADYAEVSAAPVLTGTTVTSVRAAGGGYIVRTDQGSWRAPTVVLACGAATVPAVPALAQLVPDGITSVTPAGYRNPGELPPAGVLVIAP